jgi:hypothetical protein
MIRMRGVTTIQCAAVTPWVVQQILHAFGNQDRVVLEFSADEPTAVLWRRLIPEASVSPLLDKPDLGAAT